MQLPFLLLISLQLPIYPDDEAIAEAAVTTNDDGDSKNTSTFRAGREGDSTISSLPRSPILDKSGRTGDAYSSTMGTSLEKGGRTGKSDIAAVEDDGVSDAGTEYSLNDPIDDFALNHIDALALRLVQDIRNMAGSLSISDIDPSYVEEALRAFTERLHEEVSNPFQREISVILRQNMK